MALVVVTGLPASGKTRRSKELFDYLEPRLAEISEKSQGALKGRNLAIRLVSEHDFDHDREIYRGSFTFTYFNYHIEGFSRYTIRETCEGCGICSC